MNSFGYKDVFVGHGSPDELEKIHKLDAESIAKNIQNIKIGIDFRH